MYNFNRILEKSSRDLSKDLTYSEYDAQSFYRLVKKFYEEYPNASEEEVYDYFSNLFLEINFEIVKLPMTKQSTLEFNVCRYLNRDEKARRQIFEDVILEEREKGERIYEDAMTELYTSNKSASAVILTKQMIKELRNYKKQYPEEEIKKFENFFKAPKKDQAEYRKTLSSQERRDLKLLEDVFAKDEFTQFSNFLKKCESHAERNLKESYIKSLMTLGNRFKQFGLLDVYCKRQDRIFERMGIEGLNYPLNSEEETLGVEDLFKEETLEKMPLNQLAMLNVFWVNRFTKELEMMNKSFFITKELGLLEEIKNAKTEGKMEYIRVPIDEEKLRYLYSKINFLHQVTTIIFKEFDKEKYNDEIEEIREDGQKRLIKKVDINPFLEKLEKDIGEDYKKYFSQMQDEIENNFSEDIDDYRIMENAIHNTYMAKDLNLVAILSNLYENGYVKNWGIILGEKDSRRILLGIDFEGLNMPIRLHVDKYLVQDFLMSYQNNTIFPIYEGAQDFRYAGEVLSTQLLMPVCGKQKKALKNLLKAQNSNKKNLYEHLNFLAEGTYPEHLKIEDVRKKKGKTKIVKREPPRRYIDLITGEEYIQDKDVFIKKADIKKEKEERLHE